MITILSQDMDKYGYVTAIVDPKNISKLTLEDVLQWDRIEVRIFGYRHEFDYEYIIPTTHPDVNAKEILLKNLDKLPLLKDAEHPYSSSHVLWRDLVSSIKSHVKICQNASKHLKDGELQVIFYRKESMKGYKTAVYGKKSQCDSITQLENSVRKMF